ncbi:hypothetical protein L218DRAFT_1045926 [Marasmius fiardii PR-910]|nr:hypothetical protein L218DRAFT_1045926 [Marasmius fiardii PR-910]
MMETSFIGVGEGVGDGMGGDFEDMVMDYSPDSGMKKESNVGIIASKDPDSSGEDGRHTVIVAVRGQPKLAPSLPVTKSKKNTHPTNEAVRIRVSQNSTGHNPSQTRATAACNISFVNIHPMLSVLPFLPFLGPGDASPGMTIQRQGWECEVSVLVNENRKGSVEKAVTEEDGPNFARFA